jgi:hypothetical protein
MALIDLEGSSKTDIQYEANRQKDVLFGKAAYVLRERVATQQHALTLSTLQRCTSATDQHGISVAAL